MNRIIADANVLISGLLWDGNEREILRLAARGEMELVISLYILREVENVLINKFGFDENKSKEAIDFIRMISHDVVDVSEEEINECFNKLSDKEDVPVLASAIKAGCILITGDKKLLKEARKLIDVKDAKEIITLIKKKGQTVNFK